MVFIIGGINIAKVYFSLFVTQTQNRLGLVFGDVWQEGEVGAKRGGVFSFEEVLVEYGSGNSLFFVVLLKIFPCGGAAQYVDTRMRHWNYSGVCPLHGFSVLLKALKLFNCVPTTHYVPPRRQIQRRKIRVHAAIPRSEKRHATTPTAQTTPIPTKQSSSLSPYHRHRNIGIHTT